MELFHQTERPRTWRLLLGVAVHLPQDGLGLARGRIDVNRGRPLIHMMASARAKEHFVRELYTSWTLRPWSLRTSEAGRRRSRIGRWQVQPRWLHDGQRGRSGVGRCRGRKVELWLGYDRPSSRIHSVRIVRRQLGGEVVVAVVVIQGFGIVTQPRRAKEVASRPLVIFGVELAQGGLEVDVGRVGVPFDDRHIYRAIASHPSYGRWGGASSG